jgi:sirohydrochlorin cobaltochelatase
MPDSIETTLAAAVNGGEAIGQILIRKTDKDQFVLSHRDDESTDRLRHFARPEDAIEIAKYDDAGNYRPLKTAPSLRHGWQLNIAGVGDLRRALDYFYPGRAAALDAWQRNRLVTTPLRETLNRQSGMYRAAAKVSDAQIDDVVGSVCESGGGCLRTILWKRDSTGAAPSTKLPPEKYDPSCDQTGGNRSAIPLLCQEACAVLLNECRKAVKPATKE